MDAATHQVRFQRRHAFAGLDVPHIELPDRARHDAPPVRKHGNAIDLRRRHIITKVQWTPQRTVFECPFSVTTHSPVATSHTLSVSSHDADTTRRPSGNTATLSTYDEARSSQKVQWTPQRTLLECPRSVATHLPVVTSHTLSVLSPDADTTRPCGNTATLLTYDEDTSSQKYSGRRATHPIRVPLQRRHTFPRRHVPDLERLVARPRHDAPPVRKHGNAPDLRRSQIITKVQWTPRNARNASGLSASPRTRRSPRPTS